jgi:serine/threonine protein kinase
MGNNDIKPGNILATSEGEPKLLDSGIAKRLNLGLYDAALPPYEKALKTRREIPGEQTAEHAESLNSLAVLYNPKSDHANAERLRWRIVKASANAKASFARKDAKR